MFTNTLYLKGFSRRFCGRRRRATAQTLAAQSAKLDGLAALVARFLPVGMFAQAGQRDRIFTPWVTFCAFLGQVLQRGTSCRDAVRRVQAWQLASGGVAVDDSTSGYCQARQRLSLGLLKTAFTRMADWCAQRRRTEDLWQGRVVKVLDGCSLSRPDTAANRAIYPYTSWQKPGCGFPTGQLAGWFALATGHLGAWVLSSWKAHEAPLARQLLAGFAPGEVILADRAFCGWGLLALLQRQGVEAVLRLHGSRRWQIGLVEWKKPARNKSREKTLWDGLPATLALRVVRFRVEAPGFRTREIALATTWRDEAKYPDAALAQLYRRRWEVELSFRDIKTTLGLDILRTKTPALVEKEIYLQAIAYNLVRALLLETARQHHIAPRRLSFHGTVSTLRAFAPLFEPTRAHAAQRYAQLLQALAADLLPHRPNRVEPRAVKQRPKACPRLTRPRHQMFHAAFHPRPI